MRLFLASWGDGYKPCAPKTVDRSFFVDDNGFTDDDQKQIDALQVGESVQFAGIFEVMTVARLQDAECYAARVRQYESEGLCTSDAQAAADVDGGPL